MKTALAAVLLAACATESKPDPIVPPDTSELHQLYPTAQPRQVTVPFAVDLGTCALVASANNIGQFALTHLNDAGQCEVWIGYNAQNGMHADSYCVFDPYGMATVTTASAAASSSGACGGPPGTLPLTIASPHCVQLTYN